MREIITTPDPRLREKSAKVREITDETRALIRDMIRLSLEWEDAHPHELSTALAAPQVGANQRIIIVRDDFNDKENANFTALINPEVIQADERKATRDYEGCLSVPEIYGLVKRPRRVKIKAQLEDGSEVRLKASDFLARTLLHEIDHLDGTLFIDHIKGDKKAFYRLDENGDLQPLDYDSEIKNNPALWGESA